jgi:hypothetical protein
MDVCLAKVEEILDQRISAQERSYRAIGFGTLHSVLVGIILLLIPNLFRYLGVLKRERWVVTHHADAAWLLVVLLLGIVLFFAALYFAMQLQFMERDWRGRKSGFNPDDAFPDVVPYVQATDRECSPGLLARWVSLNAIAAKLDISTAYQMANKRRRHIGNRMTAFLSLALFVAFVATLHLSCAVDALHPASIPGGVLP